MKTKLRNNRLAVLFVTLVAVASFIYLGVSSRYMDKYSLAFSLLGASAALLGFVVTSEDYLKGDKNEEKLKLEGEREKLQKNKYENDTQDSLPLSQDMIEVPSITSPREVQKRGYEYEDFVSLRRRDVIMHFTKTEKRIKDEIESLKRRANTNMILGAIIAFVGVVGLVAFILSEPENNKHSEITLIIVHWVTRLGLVSFVEIFSFFFLKMYKTELLSIQYYQDELTSIESRKIALLFSIIHDNQEDISKSIDCLVNVDRNYKLDGNQTTVEVEKLKVENTFIKTQIESMFDIIKGAFSFVTRKESKE